MNIVKENITFENKRLIIATIFINLIILSSLYFLGRIPLTIVCVCSGFIVVSLLRINVSNPFINIFLVIIFSSSTFALSHFLLNENFLTLNIHIIISNILCIIILMMLLYIIYSNFRFVIITSSLVVMIITTINYFVINFRGSEFAPHDILAIQTTMNVIDQYKFSVDAPFIYAWSIYFLIINALFLVPNHVENFNLKKKIINVCYVGLLIISFIIMSKDITPLHFLKTGTVNNGYVLNFILQFKETFVSKPQNYNINRIDEIENKYEGNSYILNDSTPNIIVIMNESFADFRVFGDNLNTNKDVIPFYDSLNENVIKGYALSSIYGGRTPNSEYEFLSGNSMAFLPHGSIVYQQYLKEEAYSIVDYMNYLSYECVATHPYLSSGWARTTVYPNLGFDYYSFIDKYPQNNMLRDFVSDKEMYEYIIENYESSDTKKKFIFGITMQNHGSYDYVGENFNNTIDLEGYSKEYSDVEQYLSLIHESDKALEYLISYFEKKDEPVVIMFYGDHFPGLDSSFYEEVHGSSFSSLEEQMLQYKVPFFVWANYDIDEQFVDCTSLNYLSNYLFEAANIEMPAYNQFLVDLQKSIPAINAYGFYSAEEGKFKKFEDVNQNEKELLEIYQILQYNCLFDDDKSEIFKTK